MTTPHTHCRPDDHPLLGRRELLKVGGLGLFGMGLSNLLRLEAHASPSRRAAKAKSVVREALAKAWRLTG